MKADVYLLRTKCKTSNELLDDPMYLLLRRKISGHVEAVAMPGTHMTLFEGQNQRVLSQTLQALTERYSTGSEVSTAERQFLSRAQQSEVANESS